MAAEIDEIVQTIERLQAALDDLVLRGLRTAGPEQLKLLDAMHEEFARIGASHIASRVSDLLQAVRADERRAGSALLRAQASLRVFERILTLQAAQCALETLKDSGEDNEDEVAEDGGEDEA